MTRERGADGISLVVSSAVEALAAIRELKDNRFVTIVLDERGRERSVEDLEIAAVLEERASSTPRGA